MDRTSAIHTTEREHHWIEMQPFVNALISGDALNRGLLKESGFWIKTADCRSSRRRDLIRLMIPKKLAGQSATR